jgi:3-oxoacyl-[acyl-carrier protein] reductase
MDGLSGKVAWVSGSSRGIGAAIAQEFARHGARVVVHGRDEAAMTGVCEAIERAGGTAIQVAADTTSLADIERLRLRTEAELGPIDIVVANAGGSPVRPAPLEDISEEGWRASVDANLTATFLTLKSVLPGMKERGSGCVITMSSAAARRAHPGSPMGYAAAKAGIELLTKEVAAQAGPFGVRANCIAPETILTEANVDLIPPATQETLVRAHPLRRLGTPLDVARAAVFLASADAAWITGIVVDVAGGAVLV